MKNKLSSHNKSFDIVRGIAIIFMVFANAAPLFQGNFPIAVRFIFSLAAPIFIFVSGVMISFSIKKYNLKYFLSRGIKIIAVAVFVDIFVYQLVPLQGFDVLYLIGLSIPLLSIILRLENKFIISLVILILIATEVLFYRYFGYSSVPVTKDISIENILNIGQDYLWTNWVFDGWFPLMPWLAIAFLGGLFGKLYINNAIDLYKSLPKTIISLFIFGLLFLLTLPQPLMLVRAGYAELFYQPQIGLMMILLGFIGIFLILAEKIKDKSYDKYFITLGNSTLSLYVFHLVVINIFYKNIFHEISSPLIYAILCSLNLFLTYILASVLIKRRISKFYTNKISNS